MYCPSCGCPDQNGRFCSECGQPVNTAAHVPQQPVKNEVNVTVNVGPPTIVQPSQSPSLGQTLARSTIKAIHAAREARREAAEHQAALARLHAAAVASLDDCHEIIAQIECAIGVEVVPVEPSTRALYVRGLERRREAAELLSRPVEEAELQRACNLILGALEDFRMTREQLKRRSLP